MYEVLSILRCRVGIKIPDIRIQRPIQLLEDSVSSFQFGGHLVFPIKKWTKAIFPLIITLLAMKGLKTNFLMIKWSSLVDHV
jgi:hypothetical protein